MKTYVKLPLKGQCSVKHKRIKSQLMHFQTVCSFIPFSKSESCNRQLPAGLSDKLQLNYSLTLALPFLYADLKLGCYLYLPVTGRS